MGENEATMIGMRAPTQGELKAMKSSMGMDEAEEIKKKRISESGRGRKNYSYTFSEIIYRLYR